MSRVTPKQDSAGAHRAACQDLIEEALAASERREDAAVKIETAVLMAYLRGQRSMLAPPPAGFREEPKTEPRDLWEGRERDQETRPQSIRAKRKKP